MNSDTEYVYYNFLLNTIEIYQDYAIWIAETSQFLYLLGEL